MLQWLHGRLRCHRNPPPLPEDVVAGKARSCTVGSARCALIAAKIDATSLRPFEESSITFAGRPSTQSTRNEIQNNCANIRDIANDTIYVDQMSHYHVPGEIVKGEIVKGVINQANLQQAKCRQAQYPSRDHSMGAHCEAECIAAVTAWQVLCVRVTNRGCRVNIHHNNHAGCT